eukprot:363631-Chlamydomonas_euryale.AAC.10
MAYARILPGQRRANNRSLKASPAPARRLCSWTFRDRPRESEALNSSTFPSCSQPRLKIRFIQAASGRSGAQEYRRRKDQTRAVDNPADAYTAGGLQSEHRWQSLNCPCDQ